MSIELAQNIFDPKQIIARVVQAVFGFTTAFLVLGDARRFLQENPQFFRACFDNARNHALADDRVSARSKAGTHENILNIAPPHCLVIDVIGRGAVTRQRALDGDFGILAPLPGGLAQAVVEHQFDRRTSGWLAVQGAVENDVLHRFATQFRGFGFTQHPAHRIDDVGLAATVRPHDTNQLAGDLKIGRINERLESR